MENGGFAEVQESGCSKGFSGSTVMLYLYITESD
jgi:hypothetical protein